MRNTSSTGGRISAALLMGMALLLAGGCATLPSSELLSEWRHTRNLRIETGKGPLSREKSAALLDGLRKRVGDLDILQKHIALEEAVVGTPLTAGNRVVLLQDGPATYEAMFKALRAARDNINLVSYIVEDDEVGQAFADLLLEKQAEGVQVNLIYDSVGSLNTPRAFFDRLREGGIKVLEFNPVNPLAVRQDWRINQRDHRKMLMVDGRIAFVGGINISSVYSSGSSPGSSGRARGGPASGKDKATGSGWRDTHLQLEGPVVAEFQKMFLASWVQQHGEPLDEKRYFPALVPMGDELARAIGSAPDDESSIIYLTLLSAITNSEKQVFITNAYFVPDEQILTALTDAAKRGVDVRLILPSHTDFWAVFHAGRANYSTLLDAGVKIYERRGALLHSKTALVDAIWSCIGSANLDWRSFLHNEEANAVVLGARFAEQMQAVFERDLAQSDLVDAVAWKQRPLSFRIKEIAAGLWEYWL